MREIPYPQWEDFLNQFGYRFAWNVTLVHNLAGRDKLIENDCFLEEFVTGHVDGHEQITIVLGSPFRPFQSCVIEESMPSAHYRYARARPRNRIPRRQQHRRAPPPHPRRPIRRGSRNQKNVFKKRHSRWTMPLLLASLCLAPSALCRL
jgi:hypothetical protein